MFVVQNGAVARSFGSPYRGIGWQWQGDTIGPTLTDWVSPRIYIQSERMNGLKFDYGIVLVEIYWLDPSGSYQIINFQIWRRAPRINSE
jgi:hypothetical protein